MSESTGDPLLSAPTSGLAARMSRSHAAVLTTAGLLVVAIFSIDTFTRLGIAVAVLYGVVVLIAAGFLRRRGVLAVAAGCAVLTVLGYLLSHGTDGFGSAAIRAAVSLVAILMTTILALRYQSAGMALQERAELLDLTHDAVLVRGMDDVVVYWNRGAEEMYGWSRAEAIGRPFAELTRTTLPAPAGTIEAQLMRTGRWEGELVQLRRDGSRIAVASRWALQRDERGRSTGVLETNTDISERHRAEEALRQAEAELAHVTRVTTLGELTASIAHEINQPLAAIVTNGHAGLRWLQREEPDLGEVRAAIERMIADGKRAGDIIWGLRELSRKAMPECTAVDLACLIDQALALVQHELLRHEVVLTREVPADLPPVQGDRVQLQQVLINLLINGIQAMAGVADRPRELWVRARRQEDGQVLVMVEDRGTGIDLEILDRLFLPFFTTRPDGMGMGLSICRSIVQAHGGRISASCNPGPGATIQFSLPVQGDAAP
ncbi:sensor histidine kinase [Geminicoccus roseus]|uniref:sensor histidine kinase n=1 Tax=Geminicoccus roseus TaxID=404900 RepID=UPI000422F345|nr:ATP-binding protein [Geminicoccus roseus]